MAVLLVVVVWGNYLVVVMFVVLLVFGEKVSLLGPYLHNTQVPPRANRVQGTATTWGGSQNSDCTACGWSGLGGNSWSLWSGNRHSRKKGRDFVDTIPLPHPPVLSIQ